jgi:hypothetical protein
LHNDLPGTEAPFDSADNQLVSLEETAMIARFFRRQRARLRARWLRSSVEKALALNRYEVRSDGLLLAGKSFHLAITWRARHIHPWDIDLAGDTKAHRLVQQTFDDTLEALDRLFIALPEVDAIDLRVLEADSRKHGTLLCGSISRRDFETCRQSSPTMRLRLLGVNYNLVDSRLEPLTPALSENEIPLSAIDATLRKGPLGAWHEDKAGPH